MPTSVEAMQKPRILLVFGGESSEHDVSRVSARNVADALDPAKYQVSLAYITSDGKWLLVADMRATEGVELMPVLGGGAFRTSDGRTVPVDVMLPILHGKNGEDGTVQGMARLAHIACAGPNMIGAAMTMDKDITKRLLRDGGVPVVDWVAWHTHEPIPSYAEMTKQLGSDILFIKPANAGSSVGVSKVSQESEFVPALQEASQHDTIVLIEPAVTAREIELAVLGTERPQVSTPGEVIPGADFYNYDDKYAASSQATTQIPAALDPATVKLLQHYARQAYRLTRGQGMARIDFFVTPDGNIYLNEINAIPGFTNISMYPKMLMHDSVTYSALLDRLIADAVGTFVKQV